MEVNNGQDHHERSHALLSPSGAHRWLNCTPSARLEEKMPPKSTKYVRLQNSYSFTYFENKESHRSNSPLYTLEYEIETDDEDLVAEISYKKKGEKSIFTDIEMINELVNNENLLEFTLDIIDSTNKKSINQKNYLKSVNQPLLQSIQ